ncbi:thimet oligopeptidase [Nocardioides luteus]|uniref:Zn-dependent oligopeptidase n=1 Tax=Nocardioides luteus TaxID=1844 RepID=A0ABQ5SQ18_9ACTN|nr:M3 family metallopeptidase [Nocardioides luteus]MDR7313188.1 thimet oligopeptidase [Nocardioides luteus]GGR43465.1 Zn-dependent oligopeptidase [Nocardioides luteus]GLJ66253.1 Zn-dependent oligopeptidase [Nocardioides luteus]
MSTPAPLALPDADIAEAWVKERTATTLTHVRELADQLRTSPPSQALDVLKAWDQLTLELGSLGGLAGLLANVHPLEAVRTACEDTEVEVDRLRTELTQDQALYQVFASLPAEQTEALDPLAARLLEKTLQDFTRAGVDRDDATRARLTEINERLTALGLEFSRVTRDDVRITTATRDQLDGMPADWLESHPAGDDGLVEITTDYPDALPVRMFAKDPAVRRAVTIAGLERGWPHNDAVLEEMFALRHELAGLLGYPDWPTFDAEVKMIGDGAAIPEFIDKIAGAAEERMTRDLEVLLERYRTDVPDAVAVSAADALYYEELVRQERYDVDSQVVRTYFDFAKVHQGLLDVTGRIFGLRYERVTDVVTWHEDVSVFDVYRASDAVETAERLGRIFLDLHPREGKYKHAAQFDLATGVVSTSSTTGGQLPEGVLVCNFSRGLMEHDHVVTLFHEFGHLVHHVLGGQGEWARFSGVATEWDFVEAPSQMLEEWAWDADVLRTFATDESGEPIPADLVARMRAAEDFGKGYHARQQMFYAAISYWFHKERPEDLTERLEELQAAYSPYPYLEGTHFFANFGHLGGYSSAYYTYMWSLVIAKDLFSAFDKDDLFDPEVAGRYRDLVLARGGEKDAADLVADFLGRPYSFDAYAAWLAS